jgi:hypothetical protein
MLGKRPNGYLIGIVIALWLATVLIYGTIQKPVSHNHGFGWDGIKYHHMYLQAQRGERFAEERPYVYRVATPWLAAHLRMVDARMAFHTVNLASVLITGLLLLWIMSVLGAQPWISTFLVAVFFLQWHAPLRQQFYDSFGVDAASQPFICLIFLIHLLFSRRIPRLALLCATTFVGVFFRESVIFATFAVLLAEVFVLANKHGGRLLEICRAELLWTACLPTIAGLFGISLTHLMVEGGGSYSFIVTILYYLYHKPLLVLMHAFYNGYGTLLIPMIVFRNRIWTYFRVEPFLWIYPLITFGLGWTAGGDTTRINFWGCFAILPLVSLVYSDLKLATFGIGIFLAMEAITTRMFFSIPDYPGSETWHIPILTGWGSDGAVFDLWSELANPRVLMISLFQYLILTAFAFVWINMIGKDRYLRNPIASRKGPLQSESQTKGL